MTKVRILLADDHGVVREGIKRLLSDQPDMQVVAEASDGTEVVRCVQAIRPDLVMMDLSMPGTSGVEATMLVKAACPDTKVLALTVHEDAAYLREFLRAGASGYLLKRAPTEELVRAVRVVAEGGLYVDPRVAGSLVNTLIDAQRHEANSAAELSDRETEVMRRIAQGFSNKEIAAQLNVSVKTVETYKARSMEKLGLKSRVDIVRLGTQRGWLRGDFPDATT
jgi:DNA-binding NarL/FixJ family response regulator